MTYVDPETGTAAPYGTFVNSFLTRGTLFNPLGSVRSTGYVPSTIELVFLPTSKQ